MTAQRVDGAIRGAMIGYGFIASQGHQPGYLACARRGCRVEILAVADVCEPRRRKAQVAFQNAKVYDDHRRLLDAHAHELDFVDIAVPPVYHAEIAHAALDRGLHVLCEKPLTTRASDALALANKAIRARCVLFPCHNYRHAPSVKTVRQVLRTGVLGTIRSITQQTFRPTHARGVPEWQPDWRRNPALAGGGILVDHGSHTLYLAFEWLGGYPHAVSARTYHSDGTATEDSACAMFSYPQGIAQASLTWAAGTRRVLYTLHGTEGALFVEDDVVRVLGRDGGTALAADLAGPGGIITTDSRWNDASHADWFADMFFDFLSAIDSGSFVGGDALDALECVGAVEACYASAQALGRETRITRVSDCVQGKSARMPANAA